MKIHTKKWRLKKMKAYDIINKLQENWDSTESIKSTTNGIFAVMDNDLDMELEKNSVLIETILNNKKKVAKGYILHNGNRRSFFADTNNVLVKNDQWELGNDDPAIGSMKDDLNNQTNYQGMRDIAHLYQVTEEEDGSTLSIVLESDSIEHAKPLVYYLANKFNLDTLDRYEYLAKLDYNFELLYSQIIMHFNLGRMTLVMDMTIEYENKNKYNDFVEIPETFRMAVGID